MILAEWPDSSLLIANQPRSPHSSDRPRRLAGEGLSEPTAGSGSAREARHMRTARSAPPPLLTSLAL